MVNPRHPAPPKWDAAGSYRCWSENLRLRCDQRDALRVAALVILLCAQALAAEMPQGKYLEAPGAKVAVILAHGQGLDADSQVVSPLRA